MSRAPPITMPLLMGKYGSPTLLECLAKTPPPIAPASCSTSADPFHIHGNGTTSRSGSPRCMCVLTEGGGRTLIDRPTTPTNFRYCRTWLRVCPKAHVLPVCEMSRLPSRLPRPPCYFWAGKCPQCRKISEADQNFPTPDSSLGVHASKTVAAESV